MKVTSIAIIGLLFSQFLHVNPATADEHKQVAENLPRLLVLPFNNASGDRSLANLAEFAGDILLPCLSSKAGQFVVVDRQSTGRRSAEIATSQGGMMQERFSRNQVLGASHIVRGSMIGLNNKLMLNTLIFDLETTRLINAQQLELIDFELETSTCNRWVNQVTAALKRPNAKSQDEILEQFPERTSRINEGISRFHNGESQAAIAIFLSLEHMYPQDPTAGYWLAKSFYQAGLPVLASIQAHSFIENHNADPRVDELRSFVLNHNDEHWSVTKKSED